MDDAMTPIARRARNAEEDTKHPIPERVSAGAHIKGCAAARHTRRRVPRLSR